MLRIAILVLGCTIPFTFSADVHTCAILLNETTDGSPFDVGLMCNKYCTEEAKPVYDGSIEYVVPGTENNTIINRTHPDAICKCMMDDGVGRVVCRDGTAEFPVTTTPVPAAGCPTSNSDYTLRPDDCACREETSSRYSIFGRNNNHYNYYSYYNQDDYIDASCESGCCADGFCSADGTCAAASKMSTAIGFVFLSCFIIAAFCGAYLFLKSAKEHGGAGAARRYPNQHINGNGNPYNPNQDRAMADRAVVADPEAAPPMYAAGVDMPPQPQSPSVISTNAYPAPGQQQQPYIAQPASPYSAAPGAYGGAGAGTGAGAYGAGAAAAFPEKPPAYPAEGYPSSNA